MNFQLVYYHRFIQNKNIVILITALTDPHDF